MPICRRDAVKYPDDRIWQEHKHNSLNEPELLWLVLPSKYYFTWEGVWSMRVCVCTFGSVCSHASLHEWVFIQLLWRLSRKSGQALWDNLPSPAPAHPQVHPQVQPQRPPTRTAEQMQRVSGRISAWITRSVTAGSDGYHPVLTH